MKNNRTPELDYLQIRADIYLAKNAIDEAKVQKQRYAKFLKGQAAYHLQQATEKLIKIQMYNANVKLDYSKIYKHSIGDLITYADDMGLDLNIPAYVRKNDELITSWEAQGRYDTHVVVRIDTLEKCFGFVDEWYKELAT